MQKNVLGLDLSYTDSGMAVWDAKHERLRFADSIPTATTDGSHVVRASIIADWIIEYGLHFKPQLIIIEDYAFSRMNTAVMGELGGIVKYRLWQETDVPNCWITQNITQWKNWAIGIVRRGKQGKQDSIREALPYLRQYADRYKLVLTQKQLNNDNISDAIHIARYGAAHYADQMI